MYTNLSSLYRFEFLSELAIFSRFGGATCGSSKMFSKNIDKCVICLVSIMSLFALSNQEICVLKFRVNLSQNQLVSLVLVGCQNQKKSIA